MRLELTRSSDLAIRLLREVSESTGPVKTVDLARKVGATPAFLTKIAQPLVANGWIVSSPGPHGGYEAGAGIELVSILEVIEAVEGPTVTGRCVLQGGVCDPSKPCSIHEPWVAARSTLLDSLARQTAIPQIQE